ncbi:unnamed protein product [Symbiodinium natans]|uniref:Uncharacterized protein n=1 Tax=Symbiodinium natans TaxID=878477 RepID=A0A812MPW2_9DINO|nr:unnamed protein product [Symbiodinium natans]
MPNASVPLDLYQMPDPKIAMPISPLAMFPGGTSDVFVAELMPDADETMRRYRQKISLLTCGLLCLLVLCPFLPLLFQVAVFSGRLGICESSRLEALELPWQEHSLSHPLLHVATTFTTYHPC